MDQTAAHDFVERLGSALTQAGLPRVASLVFSALLADEDGRMTAAELAAGLELSAGSVSGAVRYLERVGMVRRERERGSRRDVYVVDDDAWHGAMMRNDQVYAPMVAALTRGLAATDEDSQTRRRLLLTREFLVFVDQETTAMAERWERRRAELLAGGEPSRSVPAPDPPPARPR